MKYNLYAIRDSKANYFWQPQPDLNDAVAKRGFAMMINSSDLKSITGFAPGDFDLYNIGTFDSDSGIVEAIIPCLFVCNGRSVLEVKDEK